MPRPFDRRSGVRPDGLEDFGCGTANPSASFNERGASSKGSKCMIVRLVGVDGGPLKRFVGSMDMVWTRCLGVCSVAHVGR